MTSRSIKLLSSVLAGLFVFLAPFPCGNFSFTQAGEPEEEKQNQQTPYAVAAHSLLKIIHCTEFSKYYLTSFADDLHIKFPKDIRAKAYRSLLTANHSEEDCEEQKDKIENFIRSFKQLPEAEQISKIGCLIENQLKDDLLSAKTLEEEKNVLIELLSVFQSLPSDRKQKIADALLKNRQIEKILSFGEGRLLIKCKKTANEEEINSAINDISFLIGKVAPDNKELIKKINSTIFVSEWGIDILKIAVKLFNDELSDEQKRAAFKEMEKNKKEFPSILIKDGLTLEIKPKLLSSKHRVLTLSVGAGCCLTAATQQGDCSRT